MLAQRRLTKQKCSHDAGQRLSEQPTSKSVAASISSSRPTLWLNKYQANKPAACLVWLLTAQNSCRHGSSHHAAPASPSSLQPSVALHLSAQSGCGRACKSFTSSSAAPPARPPSRLSSRCWISMPNCVPQSPCACARFVTGMPRPVPAQRLVQQSYLTLQLPRACSRCSTSQGSSSCSPDAELAGALRLLCCMKL